jgi:hypothetical protein
MAQRAKSLNQIKGKAASVTCTPNNTTTITDALELSLDEMGSLLCAVTFTNVSVTGSITLKLQDSRDGGTNWQDVKTQAVSANTTYELENNTQKTADTLVWPLVRLIVVSTNAGDTATVSAVWIARGA